MTGKDDGEEETLYISSDKRSGDTAALEFTRGGSTPPNMIVVIFNFHASGPRMVICIPANDVSLDQIKSNLFKPGDWQANSRHLFLLRALEDEIMDAALSKNRLSSAMQSYTAEFHFENLSKVLPSSSSDLKLDTKLREVALIHRTHTHTYCITPIRRKSTYHDLY
jgi:hypothetical protein